MSSKTVEEFQDWCGQNASEKGFWDAHMNLNPHVSAAWVKLGLVSTEVSEAMEALRDLGVDDDRPAGFYEAVIAEMASWWNTGDKPEGLASEMADIIIRVLDMAAWIDIPLADVIDKKLEYNKKRANMHGRGA